MAKQDTQPRPVRRQYTAAFKDDLVQRCLQPGASVSGIALENGINANVLFRWRREHLRAGGCSHEPDGRRAVLLPVQLAALTHAAEALPPSVPAAAGVIEIDIGTARVRLRGSVEEAAVRCVLQTLGAIG